MHHSAEGNCRAIIPSQETMLSARFVREQVKEQLQSGLSWNSVQMAAWAEEEPITFQSRLEKCFNFVDICHRQNKCLLFKCSRQTSRFCLLLHIFYIRDEGGILQLAQVCALTSPPILHWLITSDLFYSHCNYSIDQRQEILKRAPSYWLFWQTGRPQGKHPGSDPAVEPRASFLFPLLTRRHTL